MDGANTRRTASLAALRATLAGLERRPGPAPVIPFGVAAIDTRLPGGGVPLGALHEIAGTGPQVEHGTAAALLAAALLARIPGDVLWVLERCDIHPPALAAVGLAPDRVVYVHARKPSTVLLVAEEALHHRPLAGVVGEFSGTLGLTASRRLQLAAEHSGVPCFCSGAATASMTRAAGAERGGNPLARRPALRPAAAAGARVPGLAAALWRLDLIRCRGGEPQPGSWRRAMRRVISVWFPTFPTDRLQRTAPRRRMGDPARHGRA